MKRELSRVYRLHGIKFFALPVIVVLFLVAFADRELPGYLENRAEKTELTNSLESNAAVLALGKKLQQNFETLSTEYDTSHKLTFSNTDPAQAGADLKEQVRQILQSLYFDSIELLDVSERKKGNITILTTGARFVGVPQQLPRLEAALAKSPRLLAVDNLEISVVDDHERGGQQLLILARFSAIQMQPVDLSAQGAIENKTETRP